MSKVEKAYWKGFLAGHKKGLKATKITVCPQCLARKGIK